MKGIMKAACLITVCASIISLCGCGYMEFYSDKLGDSSGGNFYDQDVPKVETPLGDFEYSASGGIVEIKKYNGSDETVAIPDAINGQNVTSVAPLAFSGKTQVREIYIPNTVTQIGDRAFEKCVALYKISPLSNLQNLGEYAFYGCDTLNLVNFDGSFNEVRRGTFADCTSLQEATLPKSVKKISENAFENCSLLKYFPDARGVEIIGSRAFCGCERMQDFGPWIAFTSIMDRAFEGCVSLREPILPQTLTNVGNYAFTDCTQMYIITFKGDTIIADTAFDGCNKDMQIIGKNDSNVSRFAKSADFPFAFLE